MCPEKRNEPYIPPTGTRPTKIVAAAIFANGKIWTGERHNILTSQVFEDTEKHSSHDQQGFWTDDNRFVTRQAALAIAIRSHQIEEGFDKPLLSDDLW